MKQNVWWIQPQKVHVAMGHHILLSVKMTLNAIINMLSAFLYHYIDSSVFLEVARKGAIAP